MGFVNRVEHDLRQMFATAEGAITIADIRNHQMVEHAQGGLEYPELIDARGATEAGGAERRGGRGATPAAPPRSHVTEVDGTQVAWTVQGSGHDLVLLHGLGDSGRTWRDLAPLLAARFRVLMPDLPGHGLSGRPDAPYTLVWFAQVIRDWMSAVGVPHAHFVAHSFGGGVAQWLLLEHRDRVDRLALVAAGGLGPEVGLGLRLASLPVPEVFYSPAAMWLGTMLGLGLGRRAFGHPGLPEMRTLARMNGVRGTGRAFCRTVRGVINVSGQYMQTRVGLDLVQDLPPIAMFWGELDPVIPVQHGRRALDMLPGSTLHVFPGCGHFPHLDEPVRMAESLLQFLDDPCPSPPPEPSTA